MQPFPDFGTISTNISTVGLSAPNTLEILVTQVNNDPGAGKNLNVLNSYQMNFLTGGSSVTGASMQNFFDAADGNFTEVSPLTSAQLFSGNGGSFLNLPGGGPISGLFSETMVMQMTFNAGGINVQTNDQIVANAVPEPATWGMMLLGFIGLGLAFRRSRRKVSFA